jgi:hypothetical protein
MAIRINEVKSSRLSDDGKELIVFSSGKYTGALELRFASDCLDDLIDALTQAKSELQPSAGSAAVPRSPIVPSSGSSSGTGGNPDQVRFEVPKNFTVTADTSGRGLVLFIINHRLENQAGYALAPDAAKQVAGGLTKSADALLLQKQAVTRQS